LQHVEVLKVFSRVAFELVKDSVTLGCQQKLGRNYSRLRKLTCQGTALNIDDIDFLDDLFRRPELILVNFERNNLKDEVGAEIFRKCLPNSLTQTLCIRRNHIADKCCEVLADTLRMNTPLRVLNLKANRVSDECCKVLAAALPENHHLTLLNVRSQVPALTNLSAQCFAKALESNRTLLKLRLRRNKIDNEGAYALAEVLTTSNSTLQELDLQGNRIDTPGGIALARMLRMNQSIQEVHMALNKFDRQKLKEALVSKGKAEDEVLGADERMIFEELPDV
jgi:Ran GTPase-activating protein (RanGAP) involved in mRNA processing and transport